MKHQLLGFGILTFTLSLTAGAALAQSSLPLDIDLPTGESEAALDAEAGASEAAEKPIEANPDTVPLDPPPNSVEPPAEPLPEADEAISTEEGSPNLADPPSEITSPAAEDPATAHDLTSFLVGQSRDTVIAMLRQDGWMVIAQTPRMVQLNRGNLGLDLVLDGTTGRVIDVDLLDLP